jgi:VCBS repeat-containing protein
MNEDNQKMLQKYLDWASKSGSGCRWDDYFTFRFGNARLEIEDIEKLVVKVDGETIENLGMNTVDAIDDIPDSITEDVTTIQKIYFLRNDKVNYLVKDVRLEPSTTIGNVVLVKEDPNDTETWYFKYTPNSNHYQYLNTDLTATDSFKYTVIDAKGKEDTAEVKITITGVNDVAIISGTTSGSVTESGSSNNGGTPKATGSLTASDVDNDPNTFQATSTDQKSFKEYGTYSITADGNWTYKLDNDNDTVKALNSNSPDLEDTFTIKSIDGTPQIINIKIKGADDGEFIGDSLTKHLTEDKDVNSQGRIILQGTLLISGAANQGADQFLDGTYPSRNNIGTMSFKGNGQYYYFIVNNQIQFLGEGKTHTDYFTVVTADGSSKQINFVTTGVNDKAVIGDPSNNQVTEDAGNIVDGFITLTGEITVEDADNGEAFFQTQVTTSGTNKGTLDLNSDGSYAYKVKNADLQSLNASDHPKDEFKIYAKDGAEKTIFITINGADDVVNTKPEIEGKGRVANVKELINLYYKNPTIADKAALGGDYDYLHVRTGQFYVKDAEDSIELEANDYVIDGYLGKFTPIFTGIKNPDGKYLVTWKYEVNDSKLDPLNTPITGTHSKDQTYTLNFKSGTDTLTADVVIHLDGRDEIEFVEGFDDGNNVYEVPDGTFFLPTTGNDVLYSGDGDILLIGGVDSTQVIYGENGEDEFYVNSLDTIFFGGDGNDLIFTEDGFLTGLFFGGNGNDKFRNGSDTSFEGRKNYMWGDAGSDYFQILSKTSRSIDWIMDFDSRKLIDGGDKIDLFFGFTDFNWDISRTSLEKKSADKEHPFLSEDAEYYELRVNTSTDENIENWLSILNLVGVDGTEITLQGLIANGNLV